MAEEKIMTRIMKLMERANHPGTSEKERNTYMDKAEQMMADHMIDRMDLRPEEKAKVIKDTWDLSWNATDSEFRYHIRDLMLMVVKHCGIRVHPRDTYATTGDGKNDYTRRRFTLIGFPEDMAYADAIWFRVFANFVSNISPKWDTDKSLAENTYQFARAGLGWGAAHKAAEQSGVEYGLPPLLKGGGAKLRDLYREECAKRGEEYSKTRTHNAYRATFVQSYASTIGSRLNDMRKLATENVSDSDKFALAIRTTREQVDEEFYKLFPEYDPAIIKKMKDNEEFEAACRWAALSDAEQAALLEEAAKEQADWEKKWAARNRRAQNARGSYRTVRERNTFDQSAWDRGHSVANKVSLSVDAEVKKQNKGELK